MFLETPRPMSCEELPGNSSLALILQEAFPSLDSLLNSPRLPLRRSIRAQHLLMLTFYFLSATLPLRNYRTTKYSKWKGPQSEIPIRLDNLQFHCLEELAG